MSRSRRRNMCTEGYVSSWWPWSVLFYFDVMFFVCTVASPFGPFCPRTGYWLSDLILVLDLMVHPASLIPPDNPQRDCRFSDWWPWLRLVWLVTTRPLVWWSNFRSIFIFYIMVSLMQYDLYCIFIVQFTCFLHFCSSGSIQTVLPFLVYFLFYSFWNSFLFF